LYPVFEYNVLRNTYVKQLNSGSRSCKYTIGQEVEINYNDGKPDEYYVKGNFETIQGGLIIMIVGIFVMFAVR